MPSSVLVGRTAELAQGRAAIDAALLGDGGLLLVTGEPGIGKTRLAEELAAYAAEQGAMVRWASCWEGGGAPAFWPFVQLVRADPAARALPVLEAVESADAAGASGRFHLFDTVSTCLFDTAHLRPLVAIIDDLQWADTSSLLLLKFLARELRGVPLLVMATVRDAELAEDEARSKIVGELGQRAMRLALGGVDKAGVAVLMNAATGNGIDAALASAVWDHTEGNPFFVVQVARLLSAEGLPTKGQSALRRLPLPDDVRTVLERRLARLSQACHELLGVASVIGRAVDVDLLALVAGTSRRDAVSLLEEAAQTRAVRLSDGGRWAFAHDLVRETCYDGLAPARRQQLHGEVGRALLTAHTDDVEPHLAELARHFLRAGEVGPGAAGTSYAARAGRRAMALLAYEEAVDHFERAVQALGPDSEASATERTALLLDLGEARLWAGDWEGAKACLNDAATLARMRGEAHNLARAALGLGSGLGGFEVPLRDFAQVDLLQEALRALDGEESVLRARVLARLSVALAWIAPVERQIDLATEAVDLCRRLGDEAALVYMLSAWCDALAGPDHVDDRLAAATEMLEIAQRLGDSEGALLARRLRVVALLERGDPTVDTEIEAFADLADRLGAPLFRWFAPQFRGCRALMSGRVERAEELVAEAERMGEHAASENAYMLGLSLRTAIRREQGRLAELLTEMERCSERFGWAPAVLPCMAIMWALTGDAPRAGQVLDRLAGRRYEEVAKNGEWLSSLTFIADAACLVTHTAAAKQAYELLLPYGARFAVDGILGSCSGSVARHLGDLAVFLGRADDAVGHFEEALHANARAHALLFVAHTQLSFGRCLLARGAPGDADKGRSLLRSAEATFAAMGIPVPPSPGGQPPPVTENSFRQQGPVWFLSFEGKSVTVPDAKGLHDLAWLLANPGREAPASELMGVPAHAMSISADPALDGKARSAYRRRLEELEEDLAEAESFNDPERAAQARQERDFLAAELASALGLGGRDRRPGAEPSERARKAVTMRIRNSIARIATVHPELARHLERSVRTGTFCCYEPERPVEWPT